MFESFSQRLVSHVADAIAINNAAQQEFVRTLVFGDGSLETPPVEAQHFVPSQEEVVVVGAISASNLPPQEVSSGNVSGLVQEESKSADDMEIS